MATKRKDLEVGGDLTINGELYPKDVAAVAQEKFQTGDYSGGFSELDKRATKVAVTGNDYGMSNDAFIAQQAAKIGVSPSSLRYLGDVSKQSTSYSNPETETAYKNQLDKVTRMTFDDWLKSDMGRALQERYQKGGQIAANGVLAKISAATGGMPSSYAGQVAQQTYNSYMDNLLEVARGYYDKDRTAELQNLEILGDYDDRLYGRWSDQYNRQRQNTFDQYGILTDMQNTWRANDERDYERAEREYDKSEAKRLEEKQDKENGRDYARGQIQHMITQLGMTPEEIAETSQSLLDMAELTPAELDGMQREYQMSRVVDTNWANVDAFRSMYGDEGAEDYIAANYKSLGFSSASQAQAAYRVHALTGGTPFDTGGGGNNKVGKITNALVQTAQQFLGLPYKSGGTSPDTGFDCSGFMQYVFRQNGINIPRTATEQYHSGEPVSGDYKVGDLLFFEGYKNAQNPGHVGMYIGNGKFIESPKTGKNIRISDVSSRKDFVGARRYVIDDYPYKGEGDEGEGNEGEGGGDAGNNTPSHSAPRTPPRELVAGDIADIRKKVEMARYKGASNSEILSQLRQDVKAGNMTQDQYEIIREELSRR